MFFNTPKFWVVVPLLYLPKISRMGFLHNTIAQACSLRARAIRPVDTLFLDRKFIGHFSRTSTRREISESRSRSAVLPYHIIAVFTKDGTGSHHGHTLEYSELKVPSEISQDPLSVRL